MKITIEVDCSPEEARAFLGLPEVRPLQERLLTEMEARMADYLRHTDPQTLVEQWMPFGVKGLEQWQSLWVQMLNTATGMATRSTQDSGDDAAR